MTEIVPFSFFGAKISEGTQLAMFLGKSGMEWKYFQEKVLNRWCCCERLDGMCFCRCVVTLILCFGRVYGRREESSIRVDA